MRLVIFGPQGAGKGTQGARLSEKYNIPAIATGDIFRAAIKEQSELGRKVNEYVQAGRLVPDDLTIQVVLDGLSRGEGREGFLLDGFPRNLDQARALDDFLASKGTKLDAALAIEVPEEVSLRRILGRRVCSKCGRVYSVDVPPKQDWKCDVCGGDVQGRNDDENEEAVRERLRLYYEQTEPLKAYYRDRAVLVEINGTGSPDEVFDAVVGAL